MDILSESTVYNFLIKNRPEYTEDLSFVESEVIELYMDGKTKHFGKLRELNRLKKIWLYNVNQKQFDQVLSYINPEELMIEGIRVADLSKLASLNQLKVLYLNWNTKATKLWNFSYNQSMCALTIEDFPILRDISELSTATTLENLTLAGSPANNPLKINTLQPLISLVNLKYLQLSNIRIKNDSIHPLASLKQLTYLGLPNTFPTEDYAFLSVKLPGVKSKVFSPYTNISSPTDGKNIMITGKYKPLLNSNNDKKKIARYENEFEQLQRKYREEIE
jgi:hypothetical protein